MPTLPTSLCWWLLIGRIPTSYVLTRVGFDCGGLAVGCMHTLFSVFALLHSLHFFGILAPTTLFGIFSLISAQGQSRK